MDPTAGRFGQCWLANSESGAILPGTIVFLGRGFGEYCAVREWQGVLPYTGEERPQRFIDGESMSRGSGSNMVAKWSEIFDTGSLATRVHMSDYFKVKINEENEASSDGEQRVGRFEYGVCDQPTPTRWPTSTQAVPIWLKDTLTKEEVLKEYDIFTDGSFDKELEPVAFLLDHEVKTISGAAVVLA